MMKFQDTSKTFLNFDLQLVGWGLDWELFFDFNSTFECYYCKHCKYQGYETFWSDRNFQNSVQRVFRAQEDVTHMCGGGSANRIQPITTFSKKG